MERYDGEATMDSYMRAARALHWRTAQLRANGLEPLPLREDDPHEPPEDFDWEAATRERMRK